ncbi:hypothetical protein GCM10009839_15730 [Catenulispora yoronensis]|uniref:Uncharacterized protein n=1 Tax=Catenulispora yoronensis TaxID=450799 RepID=A0ABP5FBC1_9ACTN
MTMSEVTATTEPNEPNDLATPIATAGRNTLTAPAAQNTLTAAHAPNALAAPHALTALTALSALNTPAAAPAKPAAPSVHRRAILTWIAVYPTITLIQSLLGTHVAGYPLPVRTLLLTVLVAPLVVYLVLPAVMKAHAKVVRGTAGRGISA